MVTYAVNLKYIIVKVVNGKKNPEAETGICSHDVSLNMVRDLFGRGRYVKYIINISNYFTGITINQINYVMIL